MTATLTAPPVEQLPAPTQAETQTLARLVPFFVAGVFLGIVQYKTEVIFWYRINEMFRFQSFHMYGVLGSALLTAFVSLEVLKRLGARARTGETIALAPKEMKRGHRYWIGGALFGSGWALCGACPGPLFALIGSGTTVYVVAAVAALAGTWTYGRLRSHLPH